LGWDAIRKEEKHVSQTTEKKQKKAGKKELAGMMQGLLDITRKLAEKAGDKSILGELDKMSVVAKEAVGNQKSIGPCFGCKKVKMVDEKNHEYEVARWFTCPHKDQFCPDCLKSAHEVAKKKRREEKEAKKKKGK
jgi:hypothetical protein